MAWVVDTSVVLDLMLPQSAWHGPSLACIHQHASDGLCICPISFVEVGPAFNGNPQAAAAYFSSLAISISEHWLTGDTDTAHQLWHEHQLRRRTTAQPKRPIADVLIAAFALRFQGIITRNATDFRKLAPGLVILEP
jgi:predicted nucleic acid-binding protein